MDTQAFWSVIGNYNERTWEIQIIMLLFYLCYPVITMLMKI